MSKSNKDLFVIGAGAHVPYGFPSGARLKNIIRCFYYGSPDLMDDYILGQAIKNSLVRLSTQISSEIYTEYNWLWENRNFQFSDTFNELLKSFVSDFLDSSSITIDAFLSLHPKWSLIGKLIISKILREFERADPVRNYDDNWIEMFINNYINSSDKDEIIRFFPNVITFNYDRLLEEYILRRFEKYLNFTEKEATELLGQLPIFHVYGKIGEIRFDDIKGEKPQALLQASRSIRVVGEEREGLINEIKTKSQEYLSNASRIFILGFGYDEQNVELVFDRKYSNRNGLGIYSTNVNLSIKTIRNIKRNISDSLANFIKLRSSELYCNELLRDYL